MNILKLKVMIHRKKSKIEKLQTNIYIRRSKCYQVFSGFIEQYKQMLSNFCYVFDLRKVLL